MKRELIEISDGWKKNVLNENENHTIKSHSVWFWSQLSQSALLMQTFTLSYLILYWFQKNNKLQVRRYCMFLITQYKLQRLLFVVCCLLALSLWLNSTGRSNHLGIYPGHWTLCNRLIKFMLGFIFLLFIVGLVLCGYLERLVMINAETTEKNSSHQIMIIQRKGFSLLT